MNADSPFLKKVLIVAVTSLLVAGIIVAVAFAVDVLLLLFLAVLFGVFLTQTTGLLTSCLRIPYAWNLALINTGLVIGSVVILFMFGMKIEQQFERVSDQLDESMEKVEAWADRHPLIVESIERIPIAKDLLSSKQEQSPSPPDSTDRSDNSTSDATSTAGEDEPQASSKNESSVIVQTAKSGAARSAAGQVIRAFKKTVATTLGLLGNLGVIYFIGLFLAINPQLYRDGFAILFRSQDRDKVATVMNKMGESMFNWLNGRLLSMLITGTGTAIALAILGVPMPMTVGVITGFLTFVPNIGAIISLALAILLALSQGPEIVIWVIIVYAALQLVESNIVTPIIQQKKTSIPPALLLAFQLIMAALTGFLGVMVATPLLAASITLVQEVWIEEVIEGS
jgi:predicted PurR-regulated permease PerM